MRKGFKINNVDIEDEYGGPAILFSNHEIRSMLRLARARPRDVFYDLGCGWGQNLIVASTEYPFRVSKSMGIENDRERFATCVKRIKDRSLEGKVEILEERIEDIISNRKYDIKDATIVFYGLEISASDIRHLKRNLEPGCRLVYYFSNGLIPEIMPDKVNFPFYLSISPFQETMSSLDWLRSVVRKKKSSLHQGEPDEKELWEELAHDYNVRIRDDGTVIRQYKKRLKKVLGI